jgi:site-specific DNA-methyltransferase (adenine-specific)
VHSKPSDKLLDFFAGSGSFGDAADRNGREVTLVDSSVGAIKTMKKRFSGREALFK